jgi:hypothetical protein
MHVLKDAKLQARRGLIASADDELIKAIAKCAINILNGNHKLTIDEKSKLKKYKNRLRALVNPKISFKSKHKLLVQKGGIIVPLSASVLSGLIGSLLITINMALQRMILVPPDCGKIVPRNPRHQLKILKSKNHCYNKRTQVRLHQDPYLKTEKEKREPIPIPIIETGSTKPIFKTSLNGKV